MLIKYLKRQAYVVNLGYTFVGWYDENGLVSEDEKYTFTKQDLLLTQILQKVNIIIILAKIITNMV